jgi:hypothetical protein
MPFCILFYHRPGCVCEIAAKEDIWVLHMERQAYMMYRLSVNIMCVYPGRTLSQWAGMQLCLVVRT